MLNGSELTTAITAVLFGAVCAGFLLHWLWSHLGRARTSDNARLGQMAAQLHDADMARDAAEAAREQEQVLLARREAGSADRLARMQARLDGAIEGREAELTGELTAARLESETMRDGLGNARRRIIELENEVEALRGEKG